MSSKLRVALEKFSAVDLSKLKFPLDGDSSAIYNSDKKEITIPYWMVAELLNEVKAAQDIAKSAISAPLRNCDVGSLDEQIDRFNAFCESHTCSSYLGRCPLVDSRSCRLAWSQMPYNEESAK